MKRMALVVVYQDMDGNEGPYVDQFTGHYYSFNEGKTLEGTPSETIELALKKALAHIQVIQ